MTEQGPTRRSFLDTLLFASAAATALTCLAPIPFFLVPPKRAVRRVVVGNVKDIPLGTSRKFQYGDRVGIVNYDGILRAFDARCTHQGCKVNWVIERKIFLCPCHGATYLGDGSTQHGPVNGPMQALPFRVTDTGDIVVGE